MDREAAGKLARALTLLIDELQYCQLYNRGFLEVVFEREELTARWHFIEDVTRRDSTVFAHVETYRL
jgi:alkaline phosphatase D